MVRMSCARRKDHSLWQDMLNFLSAESVDQGHLLIVSVTEQLSYLTGIIDGCVGVDRDDWTIDKICPVKLIILP